MVEGLAKGFQEEVKGQGQSQDATDADKTTNEENKKSGPAKKTRPKRPKTALPRELEYKKALLRKMGQE